MKTDEHARILWACRRGMLELDKLLESFFYTQYEQLSEEQKQEFIDLLDSADQDLFNWLLGNIEPDDDRFKPILTKIKQQYQAEYPR